MSAKIAGDPFCPGPANRNRSDARFFQGLKVLPFRLLIPGGVILVGSAVYRRCAWVSRCGFPPPNRPRQSVHFRFFNLD